MSISPRSNGTETMDDVHSASNERAPLSPLSAYSPG